MKPPVRFENADGFEHIVKRRGAHAKQRIAGAGKLRLLRPVLKNRQKPPVGQRLGHDPKMRTVGEQPVLFLRSFGCREPFAPLGLPARKVPRFRDAIGFAHPVEQPVEVWPLHDPFGLQCELPLKGLVAEQQYPVGPELCYTRRQSVERVALGGNEAPEGRVGPLHFLDIHRKSCHARIAERNVDNPCRAPLAGDRDRHDPADGLVGFARPLRRGERAGLGASIDQLKPTRDHIGC